VLSGPVGSGKTTLAEQLAERYDLVHIFKTHRFLTERQPGVEQERRTLQELGEKLDRQTRGGWVRDGLQGAIKSQQLRNDAIVILDSVRIPGQVESLRAAYGRSVLHIHLTAPEDVLEGRYKSRKSPHLRELSSYAEVRANATERRVEELQRIADVVMNTKLNTIMDVVTRAACHIGLYGRDCPRLVDVLVGGQYGSEGKGQVASYLSPEYDILVRVGGPNAGHTVYQDPSPYTFHHLPSGTLDSPARLILGPGAVIYPPTLLKEIADCHVDCKRLSIDPQAMIITDEDIKREKPLGDTIASTQKGVGWATARKIIGRSDKNTRLARDIPDLRPFVRETCPVLEEAFRQHRHVLLEGTQGTGLSIHHGAYPYVTSRDTTVAGCLAEAGISPSRVRRVVMVCRTYPIRVQSPGGGRTSGPLYQQISWKEIHRRSGIPYAELRTSERTSTTNRRRRVGEFDWVLLRKAASLNAPTDIALTFVDYFTIKNRNARRFEQLSVETIRFIEEVERVAAAPVSLISTRFHSRAIIDRRSWQGILHAADNREENASDIRREPHQGG
jgi:adenylosuccinate synthase